MSFPFLGAVARRGPISFGRMPSEYVREEAATCRQRDGEAVWWPWMAVRRRGCPNGGDEAVCPKGERSLWGGESLGRHGRRAPWGGRSRRCVGPWVGVGRHAEAMSPGGGHWRGRPVTPGTPLPEPGAHVGWPWRGIDPPVAACGTGFPWGTGAWRQGGAPGRRGETGGRSRRSPYASTRGTRTPNGVTPLGRGWRRSCRLPQRRHP